MNDDMIQRSHRREPIGTVGRHSNHRPASSANQTGTWLYHVNGRGVGDGENPDASLLRDAKGKLNGTTLVGGGAKSCPFGCRVVFELSP